MIVFLKIIVLVPEELSQNNIRYFENFLSLSNPSFCGCQLLVYMYTCNLDRILTNIDGLPQMLISPSMSTDVQIQTTIHKKFDGVNFPIVNSPAAAEYRYKDVTLQHLLSIRILQNLPTERNEENQNYMRLTVTIKNRLTNKIYLCLNSIAIRFPCGKSPNSRIVVKSVISAIMIFKLKLVHM